MHSCDFGENLAAQAMTNLAERWWTFRTSLTAGSSWDLPYSGPHCGEAGGWRQAGWISILAVDN